MTPSGGIFIRVLLDGRSCIAYQGCRTCVGACPVDIFRANGGQVMVEPEAEDECLLCDACVSACPVNAISIHRLYIAGKEV